MKKQKQGMPFLDFTNLCRSAKQSFSFLTNSGFSLISERCPQTNSFKDGFSFIYRNELISIQIEYYDMEFSVLFIKENHNISYLFIDKHLFSNRSGLQGNMFPRNKLLSVVNRTAIDIEENYQSILNAEDAIWQKLIGWHEVQEKAKNYFYNN
jgi:hypothetical protein